MQSTHQFYLAVKTCQVILLISVTRSESGPSPAKQNKIGAHLLYIFTLISYIVISVTCKFVTENFILPKMLKPQYNSVGYDFVLHYSNISCLKPRTDGHDH